MILRETYDGIEEDEGSDCEIARDELEKSARGERERENEKVEASEEFLMSRSEQPVSRYMESWKLLEVD